MFCCPVFSLYGQENYSGRVQDGQSGEPLAGVNISRNGKMLVVTDSSGRYNLDFKEPVTLSFSALGYEPRVIRLSRPGMIVSLVPVEKEMETVVVSGTLKAVSRLESPVPVEVYSPQFLKKNPAPSIFESLQQVNGVRPQLNCSVCNTGDIHMNGLEGPYTMITIDGMPIVSSLASVYGLFGIPTQMIDRVEIVRGPASGLYGAEAIGGLINVITRDPGKSPAFSASLMTTSWLENTADLGWKYRLGKKISVLSGINYFQYGKKMDRNNDQFTDVTLQHRVSLFQKFRITRKKDREASLAARLFGEDRWGGDLRWNEKFRGGDSIYGENIETRRWELIGRYELPLREKILLSFSATGHRQDSWYGTTAYFGRQRVVFGQATWEKSLRGGHQMLAGMAGRYNYYDDNSTATRDTVSGKNRPDRHFIPGLFLQDEWKAGKRHTLLGGIRFDYHPAHRWIFTPRFAWKWSLNNGQILRLNAGTGFRVVNLFTEDHAALTGSRVVEIAEALRPERSYNINLNYLRTWKKKGNLVTIDASAWYSHFNNQILPNYYDPRKIVYANLRGHARSTGITMNLDWSINHRWKLIAGMTLQDVKRFEAGSDGKISEVEPMLVEKWSGTWLLSRVWPAWGLTIDYTGNVYGPMRLPLISSLDPRPGRSPAWSIQNIQVTKKLGTRWEVFGGIKNLLNWTPARNVPFIIARSEDPFNKKVTYAADGTVQATPENPYALSFDPGYVYAPNQGRKTFLGVRWAVR